MDRRGFIRASCLQCAGVIGLGALMGSLQGCASLPIIKPTSASGPLQVPLSSFGEGRLVIVRDRRLEDDLLLVKHSDGHISGVLMKCTHRDQPLSATSTELHCASHGSRFDLDGRVLAGPANVPLKTYTASIEQDNVQIHNTF